MKSPRISIVIPSYNKHKYIGDTLKSIVAQKYSNLEVIIQDGGSTDGTLEIIKKYIKKYPKIFRFESKKDNGQLDAINKGMKKATGDILAYLNADDTYEKNAFNTIAKAFGRNPEALWFAGRGKVIDSNGYEIARLATKYKNFLLSHASHYSLQITNFLMQPSIFLTKKTYKQFGPFTGTSDFVMEYDLWLRLSQSSKPVIIDTSLSRFRIEPASITKQKTTKLLKEDEKIIKKFTNNKFILFIHKLHNMGKITVGRFV